MNTQSQFESIRDLAYKIPLTLEDTAVDCDKKHKLLAEALIKENYEVRFRVCVFLWSQQNLPQEILAIPHEDRCEHVYLEIFRNNTWNVLDITWDKGLKNHFAICAWDATDNAIAVEPLKIYPPEYNQPLTHNETEDSFQEDIKISGTFYEALNDWLEKERI
jgi:hypothetical protein